MKGKEVDRINETNKSYEPAPHSKSLRAIGPIEKSLFRSVQRVYSEFNNEIISLVHYSLQAIESTKYYNSYRPKPVRFVIDITL